MQNHLIRYEEFLPRPHEKTHKQRNQTYLSNVKLILYDYDVEGTWEKLEEIDDVLREIQLDECLTDDEKEVKIPIQEKVEVDPKVSVESLNIERPETKKKEFLVSLPYNISAATISQTIRNSAAIFLQEKALNREQVCSHCQSQEVLQQDQLYELYSWRIEMEKKLRREKIIK